MVHDRVRKGFVVSLMGGSKEAYKFARDCNISMLTIDDLAPNNLFSHSVPEPQYDEQSKCIKQGCYNYIQIGPILLCCSVFTEIEQANLTCEAEKNRSAQDCYVLFFASFYWIVKCKHDIFQRLENFTKNAETPQLSTHTYSSTYHKKSYHSSWSRHRYYY